MLSPVTKEINSALKNILRGAAVGLSLSALLLTGSSRSAASSSSLHSTHDSQIKAWNEQGKKLYAEMRYSEAREIFHRAASRAETLGDRHAGAMNLSNAAACSLIELRFRSSEQDFLRARELAQTTRDTSALAYTSNNLASLYNHMGQFENALRVVRQALASPAAADPALRPRLSYQAALALAGLNRYEEAAPLYRAAFAQLVDKRDFETAARIYSSFGTESLRAGRLEAAEASFQKALELIRLHHVPVAASVFDGLARLRARQGDRGSASRFFDEALAAPSGVVPRWRLFADRGQFRLDNGDLRGAFTDFRDARALSSHLKADAVPADQDRIIVESGLSQAAQGLVEAGNRIALQSKDHRLLEETFDAAEQDRVWSLRALLPGAADWRSRLPDQYWTLLARYQSIARASVAGQKATGAAEAAQLQTELRRMESEAAGEPADVTAGSPLAHIRKTLQRDSVLFHFHVSKTSAWLWAIDGEGVDVFRLPPIYTIEKQAEEFTEATRKSKADAVQSGRRLFQTLFGSVPVKYLAHSHWLLELDGPLYSVPFAALVVDGPDAKPVYLIEKVDLKAVPGALLLEHEPSRRAESLVAFGDPIYNAADPRYNTAHRHPELSLPRLPNTATELETVRREWGAGRSQTFTGTSASLAEVARALRANPAVLHFATHVVASSADYRTGLIALGLDGSGAMGLLSPREIIAHRLGASLVVMDGCHSAQAQALPGAGLMGLTRAWIGAGAHSVLATNWDIPDSDSQSIMAMFYRALAADRSVAVSRALQKAQLAMIREGRPPSAWAGYFLESRSN